jgi:hypothetical protein
MWGAIASIATQGVTSILSGVQMQRMKKAQRAADAESAKLMQDIYKDLEKNQYAAVGLPMKAYDIERENLAAAGAQAIEAGRESERTAAATAGLTMAQYRKALRDIQSEQADKMTELELLKAQEAARKGDIKMQFKAMEAEGAALASADYENRANAAAQGAIQGVIGAAGTALAAVPLFQATKGVKAASDVADLYAGTKNFSPDLLDASGNPLSYEQAVIKRFGMSDEAVKALPIYKDGKIDSAMFRDWLSSLPKSEINQILKSGFGPSQLGGVKGDIFPYETVGENKIQTSRVDALKALYDQYSGVSYPSSTQLYDNLSWMANPSRN